MQFETLNTDRLILRKVTPEVYDFVFTHYSDEQLISFFDLKSIEDLANKKSRYANGIATYNRSFVHFYLIDRKSSSIIGWCGYHIWYVDHYRAEIGYVMFDDNFKHKGLMGETLDAIIPYGFDVMGLHRIEAFVGLGNTASLHLLEKRGFNYEGHLKEHYLKDGVFEDSLAFALVKP